MLVKVSEDWRVCDVDCIGEVVGVVHGWRSCRGCGLDCNDAQSAIRCDRRLSHKLSAIGSLSHILSATGNLSHQVTIFFLMWSWYDMLLVALNWCDKKPVTPRDSFGATHSWCDRLPVAQIQCDRRLSHQHTITLKLSYRTKSNWLYFTLLESCRIDVGYGWIQLYLTEVHFYHSPSSFIVTVCQWWFKSARLHLVW